MNGMVKAVIWTLGLIVSFHPVFGWSQTQSAPAEVENSGLSILSVQQRVCVTYMTTGGDKLAIINLDRARIIAQAGESLQQAVHRMFEPYRVISVIENPGTCTGPRPYPIMPPFFSNEETEQEILQAKVQEARRRIVKITAADLRCDADWHQVCGPDWDKLDASTHYWYLPDSKLRFCTAEIEKVTGNGTWRLSLKSNKTQIHVVLHAVGSHQPWDRWRGNIVVRLHATAIPNDIDDNIVRLACQHAPN